MIKNRRNKNSPFNDLIFNYHEIISGHPFVDNHPPFYHQCSKRLYIDPLINLEDKNKFISRGKNIISIRLKILMCSILMNICKSNKLQFQEKQKRERSIEY